MAYHFLRKYGEAARVYFTLTDRGTTDFDPSINDFDPDDVQIILDQGEPAAADNGPVNEGAGLYSLLLTDGELRAERVSILVRDSGEPKRWEDQVIMIETYGDPDAQHGIDLGHPLSVFG